jgi:hypothetical protein
MMGRQDHAIDARDMSIQQYVIHVFCFRLWKGV